MTRDQRALDPVRTQYIERGLLWKSWGTGKAVLLETFVTFTWLFHQVNGKYPSLPRTSTPLNFIAKGAVIVTFAKVSSSCTFLESSLSFIQLAGLLRYELIPIYNAVYHWISRHILLSRKTCTTLQRYLFWRHKNYQSSLLPTLFRILFSLLLPYGWSLVVPK